MFCDLKLVIHLLLPTIVQNILFKLALGTNHKYTPVQKEIPTFPQKRKLRRKGNSEEKETQKKRKLRRKGNSEEKETQKKRKLRRKGNSEEKETQKKRKEKEKKRVRGKMATQFYFKKLDIPGI